MVYQNESQFSGLTIFGETDWLPCPIALYPLIEYFKRLGQILNSDPGIGLFRSPVIRESEMI